MRDREDPRYLAYVRRRPCMFCGAAGPSDAHHFPHKGMGGGGAWHDRLTGPACRACHSRWHVDREYRDMKGAEVWETMARQMLEYDEPTPLDGSEF